METKASAHHLTAIALLAQSESQPILFLYGMSLQDLSEMINLWGGTIQFNEPNDQLTPFIYGKFKVGNCEVQASHLSKNVNLMLQKEAFGGNKMDFAKGHSLTIIDNSYLVY